MKIILGALAITLVTNLMAQPMLDISSTKKLCGNAAYEFGNGNYRVAFDSLKPFWELPDAEIDNISYQSESQLKMASARFGKAIGSEYIKTETIGKSMTKHTYIAKRENTALRFMCVFYKAKNEWKVNSVSFDDEIKALFK